MQTTASTQPNTVAANEKRQVELGSFLPVDGSHVGSSFCSDDNEDVLSQPH